MHKIQSTYPYGSLVPVNASICSSMAVDGKTKRTEIKLHQILFFIACFTVFTAVSSFGQTVTKYLYLSDPGQSLDRIDPVATADGTTTQSSVLTPSTQYLYALRGAARIDFWRYDIIGNTWTTMANTPGTVSRGAALTNNGTYIYALRGASTDFWRYDPVSNSWSAMAATPAPVAAGAALIHVNGEVYAFRGSNTNSFWKYSIATNSWSVLANTPSNVDWGGALTTNGTDIYGLKGTASTTFWKYTVSTNTWAAIAVLPGTVDAGGSLSFDAGFAYALRGGNTNSFYKYSESTNTWSTIANTPSPVYRGGAIVSDEQGSFAFRGDAPPNSGFWKFNGSSWSILANTPARVDSGGAITKLGTVGKTISFTQSTAICSPVTIKAGTISVSNYISIVTGIMSVNPTITAKIKYGSTTVITLSNPVYNSATGQLNWTGTLAADVTVPAGQAIALEITTTQVGVAFTIDYDSQTKPSKISFPVSTNINVSSIDVYTASYPSGIAQTNVLAGSTKYIRTTVTDPFGYADITGLNVTVTAPGTATAGTQVAASGCTKTYQNTWVVPLISSSFTIGATAKEGYENTVSNSKTITVTSCLDCPPTANTDNAHGNGGEPLDIDVLANDSDPNNNIDASSLSIITEPRNGQTVIDNNRITYLPNGSFEGNDTLTYEICDLSLPTPLCSQAQVIININPITINTCAEAVKDKIYYMPYSENEAQVVLRKSSSSVLSSTNIRTIISIKVSYPAMTLIWDNWEDGYETNILSPTQSTTEVWGDGNIYNGVAPGYITDIIPAGGSIVLDNTMPTPRVSSNIFYDGKDKLYTSAQVSVTQVCGEPSTMAVQCMKTNVSAYPSDYGKSFTLPVGQDLPSRDFLYTALFIRAAENNTNVEIDRDNNGTFETKFTLNEGQVMMVDDSTDPTGVKINAGALVTSDKPIGVDAHFSGIDGYSSREVPIFPATWYSYVYYTPVPTTGPSSSPLDTAVVMLYNSLNRDININWTSGVPSSGTILLKANSSYRFPMPLSASAAYKFVNPTKESFVALEIADSYTPGGGGNDGTTRDWAFNLISEGRLTDFASVAWAPGSIDMTRNDNPIWVTPSANTTVYVKYDGDVLNGPSVSPCGLKYDVAIPLNYLNYTKIKDASDNNQSGTAVYTCNGAKIAAVYGEDAATAVAGDPSWDVGSTIQPFCKDKLVIANDDYAVSLLNTPVNINVIKNDAGFLAVIDPASVKTAGLIQPQNGTISINANGSILYTPISGFIGSDTFQYTVCSTPYPVVCATATVFVTIGSCPTPAGQNIISGQVFLDKNEDGVKNDGGTGYSPAKVYLYIDGNCNGVINTNELIDSAIVDGSGTYQFIKAPEKIVADNFDLVGGGNSCASGSDGNTPWKNNWTDAGDASSGYCATPAQTEDNTDVEILKDSTFGYALRLDDKNKSATREFNMQNATKAFLSFSYRKATTTLSNGESVSVQLSSDGSSFNTVFTIPGNGTANTSYVDVSNLSINIAAYNSSNKVFLRFATGGNVDEGDFVFFDNISIKFLQYNQCYIVAVDPTSLATNSSLTTVASRIANFSTAGVCSSALDFGVKRISTYTVNDENSTWQDVNVTGIVMFNDFDQENNTQTFGSFLNPATKVTIASGTSINGVDKTGASFPNAGTLTFTSTGAYTFDPAPTFTGTVNIPYKICDNGSPAACDTAYLNITVDPLPSAGNSIIANNDEDVSYGSVITNNLFANDRDPKNYAFTAVLFSYDTNGDGIPDVNTVPGSAIVAGINMLGTPVVNAGTLTINSNGAYTFTPINGFTGSVDAAYTISNTAGAVAKANLHIDVLVDINGIQNDPPFAGDDFNYTTTNQPVTGSFIRNDRDPNSDTLSFNGTKLNISGLANAIGTPVTTTQGGKVQFYANGTYMYTPPAGYTGPDYVVYTVCDVSTTAPQPLCTNAILHFVVAPGINISGKVWDDADGNVIDAGASEPETNVGNTLFVSLVDALGYVAATVPVASNGTYSFVNASPGVGYSLILSTNNAAAGSLAPVASLPDQWTNTGETRNGVIDHGNPGIIDNRVYGFANALNMDFGIEQIPVSIPFYINIPAPVAGQTITLNGGSNPPILSGKDGEDCPVGCTLVGRSLIIDQAPLNANLYYNGVLVNSGQLINNFNASLLKIEFTPVTVASQFTEFYYSFVDLAGKKDSVTAVYSLNWLSILPVKGLNLSATRSGRSVPLNWKTLSEINSDYFEIERSTDSRNYKKIGNKVKAAGTSNAEKLYQSEDDISDVQTSMVYYRVKLTDLNGKIAYSNVAVIKLPANGSIKVTPNPFRSDITISMPVEQATSISIRMLDMSGRAVLSTTQKISKEIPQVTINNLGNLTRGIYVVEVIDLQTGKKAVAKLEKSN